MPFFGSDSENAETEDRNGGAVCGAAPRPLIYQKTGRIQVQPVLKDQIEELLLFVSATLRIFGRRLVRFGLGGLLYRFLSNLLGRLFGGFLGGFLGSFLGSLFRSFLSWLLSFGRLGSGSDLNPLLSPLQVDFSTAALLACFKILTHGICLEAGR